MIGYRIPDKIPWKKITKINVLWVEKDKYETATSVDPDFSRLRLTNPDSYTPSSMWIIAKSYPSMKDKCFQVTKVIAALLNYEDLLYEFCGKIFQNRLEHVCHCGHTTNERDTFWEIVTNVINVLFTYVMYSAVFTKNNNTSPLPPNIVPHEFLL